MSTLRIVAPEIRAGDAVGNHCLYLARALAREDRPVALHAQRHDVGPDVAVQNYDALFAQHQPTDVLLLSYSTYQPWLPRLMALPGRKVAYFHGVTPVELLLEHDPVAAYWSAKAITQLPRLGEFDHLIANSRWNLDDLARHLPRPLEAGRTSVIPPITPDMPLMRRPARAVHAWQPPLSLLTVGRLAPHKRVEDVIRIVASLVQQGVPATLTLVGGATSDDYLQHLHDTADTLGVRTQVTFCGHVSDEALDRCYADADLLVSASLHEGFCIPVLEAMQQGLPVLVRQGTAATEVAGDAGLVYDTPEAAVALLVEGARKQNPIWTALADRARDRSATLIEQAQAKHWLATVDAQP